MARVVVCGGRDYTDQESLFYVLDKLDVQYRFGYLMQGGAVGADTLAYMWAKSRGVRGKTFRADWDKDGKAAGMMRNRRMLIEGSPDIVIAFPGGVGTANMVRIAEKTGVMVIRVAGKKWTGAERCLYRWERPELPSQAKRSSSIA
jgi:hypothetical protein